MLRRFTNLGHFHLIAFHGMLVREVKNRLLKVIEAKVLTENFVWHPLGHLNMLFRPPLLSSCKHVILLRLGIQIAFQERLLLRIYAHCVVMALVGRIILF